MRTNRTTVSVAELGTRLSEVVALVKRGEEVIMTEGSVPIARLVPVDATDPEGKVLKGLLSDRAEDR